MARPAIMMRKWRGHLVPADPYAQQQVDEIADGKDLSVRISVMSSTGKTQREGNRGLWWAGLQMLAENSDDLDYDDKRKAHETILRALGYVRPRYRVDNTVEYIPISTAEDAMDDDEFAVLMERANAFIEGRFGWNPWESWKLEQEAKNANQQRNRR